MVHHFISQGMMIGHKQIDGEHQTLLESLNRCENLIENASFEAVKAALYALRKQLAQHVLNEEGVMEAFNYGDMAQETAEHIRGLMAFDDLLVLYLGAENGELENGAAENWDLETGASLIFQISGLMLDLFIRSDMGFKGHLQKIDYRST